MALASGIDACAAQIVSDLQSLQSSISGMSPSNASTVMIEIWKKIITDIFNTVVADLEVKGVKVSGSCSFALVAPPTGGTVTGTIDFTDAAQSNDGVGLVG